MELDEGEEWKVYKEDWHGSAEEGLTTTGEMPGEYVWSMWSKSFVSQISHSQEVESVIALGSVLAISLRDENAGQYSPYTVPT
jgi:dethiobiotin synthetase/adenosylmethionine--8-amino-7-oxononanoate aminotransferase